ILLGWPHKTGFLDKLIGDKMESILENTNKTLFIGDFKIPLGNHKKIFVIVPPNAELEEGFGLWVNKVLRLSVELSIPLNLNSTVQTFEAIKRFSADNKLDLTADFYEFNDWDDFLILSRNIADTDFIIMVSARRGYISHFSAIDNLPGKLERHFEKNSKLIIYPQ